jgi:hypothetical protein
LEQEQDRLRVGYRLANEAREEFEEAQETQALIQVADY